MLQMLDAEQAQGVRKRYLVIKVVVFSNKLIFKKRENGT